MSQFDSIQPLIQFEWAGESFAALPDKALYWPRRRTLCIADLHLGKAAAFRRAGIPVPEATTADSFSRLSLVLERTGAVRLVILGDMLHARDGRTPDVLDSFTTWRRRHASLDILLIRGNHDHRAGDPPAAWGIHVESEPYSDDADAAIAFAHHPEADRLAPISTHILCGHIHPAIGLSTATRSLCAPCFWFSGRRGVLPAFGSFTGNCLVEPGPDDRVLLVGNEEVLDLNALPCASASPVLR